MIPAEDDREGFVEVDVADTVVYAFVSVGRVRCQDACLVGLRVSLGVVIFEVVTGLYDSLWSV